MEQYKLINNFAVCTILEKGFYGRFSLNWAYVLLAYSLDLFNFMVILMLIKNESIFGS